jgi:anti-sigma factor (TIGR02949 family)
MTAPRPLTCNETFERLDDYVDRALPPEERRRVEAHLADCVVCAREYRFEQNVIDHVRGKLQRLDVPADLVRKVAEQLAAARKQGTSS